MRAIHIDERLLSPWIDSTNLLRTWSRSGAETTSSWMPTTNGPSCRLLSEHHPTTRATTTTASGERMDGLQCPL